ncbi:MAG: ferritin-like domain-containing protein [Actinomycetia bacterium]|nr:ferritin-like domain-containing protein [Actinomycetes bacterium]
MSATQHENANNKLDNTDKFGRRGLFRIGGLTAASAAAIVACGTSEAGKTGNIGVGQDTPKLPDPVLNNGVYLRTLAGIELSIAAAYQRMIDDDMLSGASATFPDISDLTPLVEEYATHHTAAAATLNDLAVEQGAERWECGNTRLDSAFIDVVFDRVVNGAAATDAAKAISPSDDPTRDMLNLVHTLESLSAASCQGVVPQVSEPSLRASAVSIGVVSARQAALMALLLNPGGYVSVTDAENALPAETTTTSLAPTPTQNIAEPGQGAEGGGDPAAAAPVLTEIPLPVAIPGQFGSLAAIVYVGGAGDENGVRLKLNFETPSLNSYAYPFDSCAVG